MRPMSSPTPKRKPRDTSGGASATMTHGSASPKRPPPSTTGVAVSSPTVKAAVTGTIHAACSQARSLAHPFWFECRDMNPATKPPLSWITASRTNTPMASTARLTRKSRSQLPNAGRSTTSSRGCHAPRSPQAIRIDATKARGAISGLRRSACCSPGVFSKGVGEGKPCRTTALRFVAMIHTAPVRAPRATAAATVSNHGPSAPQSLSRGTCGTSPPMSATRTTAATVGARIS